MSDSKRTPSAPGGGGGAPASGPPSLEARADTLPAAAKLIAGAANDLGQAETVATPHSQPRGSGSPPELAHARTETGRSGPPSPPTPGGPADEVHVAVGTLLGKRYRVHEHIGAGGMGTVYAGHDALVDQPVALKFIRPSLASDYRERERLRAEVRLAQSVTHENVCRTYTLDEIDGHLFIVMELLRGPSLSQVLRERRLSVDEARRLARDILAGLRAAHARGILHRDIKPGNVKVAQDGRAVLMDFGMARTSEQSAPMAAPAGIAEKLKVQITHTLLGGTPGYIAPEILRGKRGDARADLYSFGVMLFEMLAGQPPLGAANAQEMIVKHLDDVPPRVDSLRAEVPAHVADVVAQLLEKDPEKRPASADAVSRALDQLPEAGEPSSQRSIQSVPSVTGSEVSRAAATTVPPPAAAPRSRRGLVAGAALAVLVGGGLVVGLTRSSKQPEPAGPREAPTPAAQPPLATPVPAQPAALPPDAAAPAVVAGEPASAAPDAGVVGARRTGKRVTPKGEKTNAPPPPPDPGIEPKDDPAAKRRKQLELEQ